VTYHILLEGDCVESLSKLPDCSVQMCVTSPPYYGLRDYGMDGQLGLEETVADYIAGMVGVFREVYRVLKDDGTLWLNIGDSYAGGGYANHKINDEDWFKNANLDKRSDRQQKMKKVLLQENIKPKELIGIPWMLAFAALRSEGWYLRQDIIWHKPNPMPESVKDRCTKAHEYIFLLTKQPTYYFDNEAMKEPAIAAGKTIKLGPKSFSKGQAAGANVNPSGNALNENYLVPEFRNRRSVWSVTTKPFKGAHFATFPPDLIEPCILAGSGSADTVLDPFGGSGTTALVSNMHGRNSILCELNPDYAAIAQGRVPEIKIMRKKVAA
jgi:DNA modification methylase